MSAQLPDTPLAKDKFQGARVIGQVGSRELVEELNALAAVETKDGGGVATVQAIFAGQPTATDPLVIGADTYEFVTAGGDVTTDTNIAVAIGGSAELTLDNLVLAINAADLDNEHDSLFLIGGVLPALANGTENLVADKIGTTFCRIRSAVKAGGTAKSADPSIVLDASGATNISFDCGDVNMNTLSGKVATTARQAAITQLAITADMITATQARISFPFTVTGFLAAGLTALGTEVALAADLLLVDNGDVLVSNLAALGNLAATDVVTVLAWD